jgi:hypothetical protein
VTSALRLRPVTAATRAAAVARPGFGTGLLTSGRLAEFAMHHSTATATVGEEDAKEHHDGCCEED